MHVALNQGEVDAHILDSIKSVLVAASRLSDPVRSIEELIATSGWIVANIRVVAILAAEHEANSGGCCWPPGPPPVSGVLAGVPHAAGAYVIALPQPTLRLGGPSEP